MGTAIGFNAPGYVLGYKTEFGIGVEQFDGNGSHLWRREWHGVAEISAVATEPGGTIAFAGAFHEPINFGGTTLMPSSTPEGPTNGFAVKLSASGDHIFSTNTYESMVGGIATSADRTVVSGTVRTQFHHPDVRVFDNVGALVTSNARPYLGDWADGGTVAITASGRVVWNASTEWPRFYRLNYLTAFAP